MRSEFLNKWGKWFLVVLIGALAMGLFSNFFRIPFSSHNINESWKNDLQKKDLSPEEFTRLYAHRMKMKIPNADIKIIDSLELEIKVGDRDFRCWLGNFWGLCKDLPEARLETCDYYIEIFFSNITADSELSNRIDPNLIVPVMKDVRFLESVPPQKDGSPILRELLAGDIYITYALNFEDKVLYLSAEEIQICNLEAENLRKKAVDNLKNILPEIKRVGGEPVYLLEADHNYEASLLLINNIWERQAEELGGPIIAAVPCRDVLIYTTSDSAEGIERIRKAATMFSEQEFYAISSTLLIWKEDHWEVFEE